MKKTVMHRLNSLGRNVNLRSCAAGIVLLLCCLISAMAIAETDITLDLKGVSSGNVDVWRAVSLNGRFDVMAGNGTLLGQITANPTGEQLAAGQSATLTIADDKAQGVSLMPVDEDFGQGYICLGPIPLTLDVGTNNDIAIFAYADQGYFELHDTITQTGAPAGVGEYMVLNAQGETVFSFQTDENGYYMALAPLPTGDYQLVQMTAPTDTLPLSEPMDFTVSTYFGGENDITQLLVQNEAAPIENRVLGHLLATTEGQLPPFYTERQQRVVTVSGILDGDNTVPLQNLTVTLRAPELVQVSGTTSALQGAARFVSLRAETPTPGVTAEIVYLDGEGEATDDPSEAESAVVTYYDESGKAQVPVQFTAGTITAVVEFLPYAPLAGESTLASAFMPVQVDYTFDYPGNDGMSIVHAKSQVPQAAAHWMIDSDRASLTDDDLPVALTASGHTATVRLGQSTLPSDLPLVLQLPDGMRLADGLGYTTLRTAAYDYAITTLSELQSNGLTLTISAGDDTLGAPMLWALDPQTLPATADNPHGLLLATDEARENALLDLLLGKKNGWYAVYPCVWQGALDAQAAQAADTVLLKGQLQSQDAVDRRADHAALYQPQNSMVAYGVVVEENEATGFAIAGLADEKRTDGTLKVKLPRNTATLDGTTGTVTIQNPSENETIYYQALLGVNGQVLLDEEEALAGAQVTLLQDGKEVQTVLTDASGAFCFEDLPIEAYALRVAVDAIRDIALVETDNATLESENTLFAGPYLPHTDTTELTLHAVSLGSIRCTVTEEEQGMESVAVSATDEMGRVWQGLTDDAGIATLERLPAGTYAFHLDIPQAHVIRRIGQEEQTLVDQLDMELQLQAGAKEHLQITMEPSASVIGAVPSLGEGHYITAASLQQQFTMTTDADGYYRIDGLPSGDYTVYLPLPQGQTLPLDSPWRMTAEGDMAWLTVTLEAGNIYQMPQADFQKMTAIKGAASLSSDGESQLLSGVSVWLEKQADDEWTEVGQTATDTHGEYAFLNLTEGSYRVRTEVGEGLFVASVGSEAVMAKQGASGCISLAQGDVLIGQSDITLIKPASVQISAFVDDSDNGTRDKYEPALPGVALELLNDADEAIASAVTDDGGVATLSDVLPGAWRLRFTLPVGYLYGAQGKQIGTNFSLPPRATEAQSDSDEITLLPGETFAAGVGAMQAASFSGKVWSDEDNDGIMQDEDEGVSGVILTLKGAKSGTEYTLTTDESGVYTFQGLRADKYTLTALLPDGMLFTRYSKTGGDMRSVFTTAGVVTASREFAVDDARNVTDKNIGVITEGTIGGTAFMDLNYNGVLDEDEPGLPGVTVEIIKISNAKSQGKAVTDSKGRFAITNLRGGDYRVRAILPNDGTIFSATSDEDFDVGNHFVQREGRREYSVEPVTIENGEAAEVVIGAARGAKLSGKVYVDEDFDGKLAGSEKGVSGIDVLLKDADGVAVAQTSTNAKGLYAIGDVMPGSYTLWMERKPSFDFTRYTGDTDESANRIATMQDGYGVSEAFDVEMGKDISGLNGGILRSSSVAGMVFSDANDNGMQDAEETGLYGVTVRLYSEDAKIDRTQTTADNGTFLFEGVMPGRYTVTYQLPEHVEFAGGAHGTDSEWTSAQFSITAGDSYTSPTIGAVVLGSFEGVAYHDANGNALQDEGEETLPGVLLTFTPARSGLDEQTVTTGEDGTFFVERLRPTDYQMTMDLPDGYIITFLSADDPAVCASVNPAPKQTSSLDCPWEMLVSRRKFTLGASHPASIGGSVGLDEDRNGRQDDGERLMSGLSCELYDENLMQVVQTMTTGEDGQIWFEDVRPSRYTVRFTLPAESEAVQSNQSTFQLDGDTMATTGLDIAEGESYGGLYGVLAVRTRIGGVVRLEKDGMTTPQAGIAVRLLYADDKAEVATAVTDASGAYLFTGLWPDQYIVEADLPAGKLFVSTEDERFAQGLSVIAQSEKDKGISMPIDLKMAQNELRQDVMYLLPGIVGDYVWLDVNHNGLNDAGEPPIAGATVQLLSSGEVRGERTTDANGYYLFDDVYPGTYTLRISSYDALDITKRVERLSILTSCLTSGDGVEAESDEWLVESGAAYFNMDCGFVVKDGQKVPESIRFGEKQDWTISNTPKDDD